MNLLIKNAVIIQPGTKLHEKKRDILIKNGTFEKIAPRIPEQKGVKIITHPGLHISIGWMDMRVQFGEPGYEERETLKNGLKTAANSGFTRIALQPDTQPVTDHRAAIQYLKAAERDTAVSLHPIGSMTRGMQGEELAELYDMQTAGAVAFSDYIKSIDNANLLKVALRYAQAFDGLLMSFPQDTSLVNNASANESAFTVRLGLKGNPPIAESIRISRDISLLEYTGGKLHIPLVSTKEGIDLIKKAKRKGLDISCSVSAHHLYMTDKELEHFDTRYKVSPPLRTSKDINALRKAVKDGTVCCIVSDHRPLDIEVKKKEFSMALPGTIGLESLFGALHWLMPVEDFIDHITRNPRERLGIEIPEIAEGNVAEITLFETQTEWTFEEENILSSSKNSAFLGKKMKGKALGIYHKRKWFPKHDF